MEEKISADQEERHGYAAAHPAGLCWYRPAVVRRHRYCTAGRLACFLGFIPLAIAVIAYCRRRASSCSAGLKVLKPEEALVLTLFGDYIGTLKGQGFYWVNPFCTAVNPAAGTDLSQSGDVNSGEPAWRPCLRQVTAVPRPQDRPARRSPSR